MASDLAASEILILSLTALSIGAVHTILGPDHYLPFVAMSKAGGWTARKTLSVTVACGLGHVAGSVVIGSIGLLFGIAVMRLESLESLRGDFAAWMMIACGLAYLTWGVVQAVRNVPHEHVHVHTDGTVHSHSHTHHGEHVHVHSSVPGAATLSGGRTASVWTPWLLFLVFVFGPCEPLIPLLMYPAAKAHAGGVAAVVAAFAAATLVTMSIAVLVMRYGLSFVRVPAVGRFSHALAGLTILLCGVLVKIGL